MSISPQSLARTRDKRHPRTPARFDDFIPPEATYRNVAEALRSKGSKHARRDASSGNYVIGNKEALENLNLDANVSTKLTSNPSTSSHSSVAKKSDDSVTKISDDSVTKKSDDSVTKKPDDSVTKKSDDSVTKKCSPFHPSITISNGVTFKGPSESKPLIEKEPTTPANNSTPKSSSSKKKTKGLSLMIRTSPNGPYHDVNNPQVVQRQVSQQMRYSNLNQNTQYGSRLMLNEPIHLPKSVSTIAPITATLQQIANQARRPPFISKKAEAYIAYQEARKFDYLMSAHKALVRITQNLDYPDLLNLKKVNKTWRSVIMCESVWKSVRVKSTTLQESKDFITLTRDLVRHRTKELVLESIRPKDDDSLKCISALSNKDLSLKRLIIRSENQLENRFALELLSGLYKASVNKMNIVWKVKVVVSDSGLALVPIECRTKGSCYNKMAEELYCYPNIKRLLSGSTYSVFLEQSELEDLFNAGNKDESDSHPLDPNKPIVYIRPI